jgi:mRNA interferase RelE/StbE
MRLSSLTYRIELTPVAARTLRKLDDEIRRRVARKINTLATNPRPADAKKIEGEDNLYRIRAGDYRIIYTIRDEVLLIVIITIGHRRDIYKSLRRR